MQEDSTQFNASESVQSDMVETFTSKQLRYAKRKSPEEQKQDKLAAFSMDSSGSADDDDASRTQPPDRKKKKFAKESALEAQTAHTHMCKQASSTLTLMIGILQKLDKKLEDM